MNSQKRSKGRLFRSGSGSFMAVLLILMMAVSSLMISVNSGEEAAAANEPPVANAGDDVTGVLLNDPVILDGSNSTDEDLDNCTILWECTSHTDVEITNSDSLVAELTVFTEDTITVQLTITDPMEEESFDEMDIVPDVNQNPDVDTLDILPTDSGPEGPFYEIGTPIEFNASLASDPEGRVLEFNWVSDITGEGSFPSLAAFTRTMNELGWHNITLTVTDPNGGMSEIVKRIKVREDRASPVAGMTIKPIRSSYDKGEVLTLDGTSTTDANSFDTVDTMNFTWSTNQTGGYIIGYGAVLEVTLDEGYHNITLDVVDTDGLSSSVYEGILIVNQPPVALVSTPGMRYRDDMRTVNVSEIASFSAILSSDPNGDDLDYSWDFGDGNTATGMNVTHSWSEFGLYNVTMELDDGSSKDFFDNISIEIAVNTIPTAIIEEPGEILTGEPVTFSANGSGDEDGDDLTYRWDIDGDGTFDQSGFNTTFTYREEGEITVTLSIDDGFAWAEYSIDISPRIPNEEPVAQVFGYQEGDDPIIVELSDDSGEITLDATASYDPDDDINGNKMIDEREKNNLTYWWDEDADDDHDNDGIKDNDFTERGKTLRVDVDGDDLIRVVLNATDERGLSSYLIIKIQGNNPPEVISMKSDLGTRLYVNSTVRITSTADDDDKSDRNLLEYHWDFGEGNSGSVINDTSATQSYKYNEPGTYQIVSWVTDGNFWVSNSMTVTVVEFNGLSMRFPKNGAVLSGRVILKGNVEHNINYDIKRVEISIDGGEWQKADNPPGWEFELITWEYLDGEHEIDVRVEMDGGVDQQISVSVTFKNAQESDNSSMIMIIIVLIVIVALIGILYFLFGRSSSRARDLMTSLPPPPGMGPSAPGMGVRTGMMPPGAASPATEQTKPPETSEPEQAAPPADEKKTVRVKCPNCRKVFRVEDTGDRPLEMKCTHCGVKGTISHLPGDEEEKEEEGPQEEEDVPEPVSIICPSCSGMFEITEVTDTARCPFCNAAGELDEHTINELEERFGNQAEDIKVRCPSCQSKFDIKSNDKDIICPFCGASGSVPQ